MNRRPTPADLLKQMFNEENLAKLNAFFAHDLPPLPQSPPEQRETSPKRPARPAKPH